MIPDIHEISSCLRNHSLAGLFEPLQTNNSNIKRRSDPPPPPPPPPPRVHGPHNWEQSRSIMWTRRKKMFETCPCIKFECQPNVFDACNAMTNFEKHYGICKNPGSTTIFFNIGTGERTNACIDDNTRRRRWLPMVWIFDGNKDARAGRNTFASVSAQFWYVYRMFIECVLNQSTFWFEQKKCKIVSHLITAIWWYSVRDFLSHNTWYRKVLPCKHTKMCQNLVAIGPMLVASSDSSRVLAHSRHITSSMVVSLARS